MRSMPMFTARLKKAVINRLSKAVGHIEPSSAWSKTMPIAASILIQLAAVKAAINNTETCG